MDKRLDEEFYQQALHFIRLLFKGMILYAPTLFKETNEIHIQLYEYFQILP